MPLPKRKLPRLSNFDYSQNGCYFITICTHEKKHSFGKVVDSSVRLNQYGQIAQAELIAIPDHYSGVSIEHSVIMPNHVHLLVTINRPTASEQSYSPRKLINQINTGNQNPEERASPFPTISNIIGSYKSGVTKNIHQIQPDMIVWQTSFYDHIIRDEKDYYAILEYIENNPIKWELDVLY